jgi:lipopolysaccharide/colanic/teichoic acid biosynthesis glycosyltransferase
MPGTTTFVQHSPGPGRGAPLLSASTTLHRQFAPSTRSYSPHCNRYFDGPKQWFERALLLASLPVWALLLAALFSVLLIPLRGRVFLRQARTGRNGRVFRLYKFRTLRCAVDIPFNKAAARVAAETVFLGAWLRRTGLDELPQLINVLKGDMHLIGPRPFIERDLEHLSEEESMERHAVKPGLTGLWQVTRRYDDSDLKFAEVDREYIRTATARLDMRILYLTLAYALRQRGR